MLISYVSPLKSRKETQQKTSNTHIRYLTKQRVDRFVTLITSAITLILVVVPTYALYHVTDTKISTIDATSIGITVVAMLIFSAVCSLFTKPRDLKF